MRDYAQEFNSAYLGRWIFRNGLSILYVGTIDDATAEAVAGSQNFGGSYGLPDITWNKLCVLSAAHDDNFNEPTIAMTFEKFLEGEPIA